MTKKLSDISIHAWILENELKTESGKPYDIRNHMFLYDILADWSPKQVWLKAAQVGGTLAAALKSMYAVKVFGLDAIYTMPSSVDIKVLVGGKINRMIVHNPVMNEWMTDKNSIEQKQVGNNMIYYRGTTTEQQAISVTSDLNIHDEVDRCTQRIIEMYKSRLDHSEYAWEWFFSNPSVEGNGVSKYWKRSDQKEWFITCPKCKKEQYLKWAKNSEGNVCMERKVFQCRHCKAELSNEDRRVGRWVARFKDREYSGYHISQLMVKWKSAKDIIHAYENNSEEYFYNFVLGLPYVGSGNKVTPEMIYNNCTQEVNGQEHVIIGCDSGIKKHYTLGNDEGIFYYGMTEEWEDIRRLLKRFHKSILIVDAMPDITGPRKLREEFKGRVFLNHYARDRKTMQLIRWGKDKESGNVLSDRNRMIQLLIDEFTEGLIPLEGNEGDWEKFYSHWDTLYRLTDVDSIGSPIFTWESSNGNDHWCFVEDTKVLTRNGNKKIKNIEVGEEVLTRAGYKPVERSWLVKEDAEVISCYLSNGRVLTGTPDHKVFTNGKWITLDAIVSGDTMYSCQIQKQLLSTELSLDDTLKQKQDQSRSTMYQMAHVAKEVWVGFTKRFGNSTMGRFLKVLLSTIKTAILSIMRSLILRVNKEESTCLNMQKKTGLTANTESIILNIFMRFVSYRTSGEKQPKARSGTQNMLSIVLFYLSLKSLAVFSVVLRLIHAVQTAVNTVPVCVMVVGIERRTRNEDVYNLTIKDQHEYFASGVLVANCHSSVLWRIGMDRFGRGQAKFVVAQEHKGITKSPEISLEGTAQLIPGETYDWDF